MKRHNLSSTYSTSQILCNYQDVLTSLQFFEREKLLSIATEVNQHLSVEISILASLIPKEIWDKILGYACTFIFARQLTEVKLRTHFKDCNERKEIEKKYKEVNQKIQTNIEKFLRTVGSVCHTWSKSAQTLAQHFFEEDKTRSNWVLSQFQDVPNFRLILHSKNEGRISNESIRKLTNLTFLCIYVDSLDPRVTADGINEMTNLRKLEIIDCTAIHNAHEYEQARLKKGGVLTKCTNLRSLHTMSFSFISAESFKYLPNLTSLNLEQCPDHVPLDCIPYLSNLTSLHISPVMTDDELKLFTSLRRLKCLNHEITNDGISTLTNLTSLVTDEATADLNEGIMKLVNLKSLDLYDTAVISYDTLSKLTQLETLRVYFEIVNYQSLQTLTNLTHLDLGQNPFPHELIEKLSSLTELSLRRNSKVTAEDIMASSSITRLNLDIVVSGESLINNENLSKLTQLKSLSLRKNLLLNNEGLKNLFNLRSLNICSSNSLITEEGLMNLTNLTHLNIEHNSNIDHTKLSHLGNLEKIIW